MKAEASQPRIRTFEQRRRDTNAKLQRCINHPLSNRAAPHGPRVDGHVRCAACVAVYARSR